MLPALATRHSAAGAKAFAVFFIKTIDWAYATTSTTYMRHYFERRCIECRSVADSIDRDQQRGHHFVGGRFRIHTANAVLNGSLTAASSIVATIGGLRVVSSSGETVGGEDAHPFFKEAIQLVWKQRWAVFRMEPQ